MATYQHPCRVGWHRAVRHPDVEQDVTRGLRAPLDGDTLHVPDGAVPREGGEGLPRARLEDVHHSAAVQRFHPLRQVFLSGAYKHTK